MSQFPPGVRAAQVVGLTGAAFLAGNISTYTLSAIPALQSSLSSSPAPSPATIARQWLAMYNTGKAQNPPIALLTASAFSYLAWTAHSGTSAAVDVLSPKNATWLYAAAAVVTVGIVPWTLAAMSSVNSTLAGVAEGVGANAEKRSDEVSELLSKWKVLNGVRGVFPFVGAVLGFLAI
ncbi:DUF1772 domain-containing protein [Aspergillus stella-maris]|uniref:DUF1772 domain-containing protein n=1 Tax=Aspergillus stella-maris TaxID=1810926 RepID=UPI003CCD5C31